MMLREQIALVRRIWGRRDGGVTAFTRVIALGSVALSSAALLITLSVITGFERELEKKTSLFIAHVDARILRTQVQLQYSWWLEQLQTSLASHPLRVVAYTETEALLAYRGNIEPALIHIDTPGVSERIATLGLQALQTVSASALAIGRPLAERLGVKIGDTVALFVAAPHHLLSMSSVRTLRAKIAVIYESGLRQYDESVVFASPHLAALLHDGAFTPTGFSIWLSNADQSRRVARQIDSLYGTSLYARTYTDRHPAMFAWIALQKKPIPIVVGILSVVAAFNILTLLFVSIVERRNTIATLRLVGIRRAHLVMMVTAYAIWIGLVGYSIGLAIAIGFESIQRRFGFIRLDADVYFLDRLPIEFVWWHGAVVGVLVIILTITVTAIPAYASTRISPLTILRIK